MQTYFGKEIPEHIKDSWNTVGAARWRIKAQQHAQDPVAYPPTQHTDVRPSFKLCGKHSRLFGSWRDWKFDPVSGNAWPGNSGTFFNPNGGRRSDMERLSELRRAEWDWKTLEQLREIEHECAADKGCGDGPELLLWRPGGGGIIAECDEHGTEYEIVRNGYYYILYVNGIRRTANTMNQAKAKANAECKRKGEDSAD